MKINKKIGLYIVSILYLYLIMFSPNLWAREKILLVPLSEKIEGSLLKYLRDHLEKIFSVEVDIGTAVPLVTSSYHPQRKQYNSSVILNSYKKPKGYDKVLLIANVDLYASGLNFVFGEADILNGVAIISLLRLRGNLFLFPNRKNLFKERSLKEAVHELGHLYGLRHCNDPKCVMYFSNTLNDTDRKSYNFCRRHKEELKEIKGSR